jgi:hypothetical protein
MRLLAVLWLPVIYLALTAGRGLLWPGRSLKGPAVVELPDVSAEGLEDALRRLASRMQGPWLAVVPRAGQELREMLERMALDLGFEWADHDDGRPAVRWRYDGCELSVSPSTPGNVPDNP